MKQLLLAALAAWCLGCEDEVVPPVYTSSVQLAVEDAGVTDVWFRMSFADSAAPRVFALRRDGATVLTGTVTGRDMIVGDSTAVSGHSYGYKVFRLNGTTAIDSSTVVQVTTLDTTSHIFSQMRIDTLGVTSSELRDVAIINDTLIYAVGEMYLRDSTGQIDPIRYNLAVWNGRSWAIQRAPYYYQGQTFYNPIQCVFAFERNDIWMGGNGVIHWNGQLFVPVEIPSSVWGPVPINKIWGTSHNDLYLVGDGGSIAHYDGTNWRRLESGTTVNLNDIWGSVDTRTGKRTILCAASNRIDPPFDHKILRITEQNIVDTVAWVSDRRINSLWFQTPSRIYACGGGVFQRRPDSVWREVVGLGTIPYFTDRLRGVAVNDWFVVGDFGTVAHWNGTNAKLYPEAAAALYYSCDYEGDLLVAVGVRNARAVVLQMLR